MLSEREQRVLEDLERSLADGVERPPGRRPPRWRMTGRHWRRAAGVGIGSITVFLMVDGAVTGGLALAVAAGLGWLLWRCWPQLREQGRPTPPMVDDGSGEDSAPLRPAHRAPRHPIIRRRADS